MNTLTLETLLCRRTLRPGEAVTILVPLLQTLTELHDLRCTLGRISAETVVFDDAGRAVFDGWQELREHGADDEPGAGSRARGAPHEAIWDDVWQFVVLARRVLARVESPVPGCDTFLEASLSAFGGEERVGFLEEAEGQLFAVAVPEPVDLFEPYDWWAEGSAVLETLRSDVEERTRAELDAARPGARLRVLFSRGRSTARAFPGQFVGWWRGPGRSGGGPRHGPRPRTVFVGAVVCAVAVIGSLVAVPGAGEAAPAESPAAAASSVAQVPHELLPGTRSPTPVPTGEGPPGGAAPTAGSGAASVDASMDASEDALADSLAGDDPVAAGTALVRLRSECFRQRSVPCLDGVDQAQSAARTDDEGAIAAMLRSRTSAGGGAESGGGAGSGGDTGAGGDAGSDSTAPGSGAGQLDHNAGSVLTGAVLTLVQATGATALVSAAATPAGTPAAGAAVQREPASLLLVKGEAGWRIREIFTPG